MEYQVTFSSGITLLAIISSSLLLTYRALNLMLLSRYVQFITSERTGAQISSPL